MLGRFKKLVHQGSANLLSIMPFLPESAEAQFLWVLMILVSELASTGPISRRRWVRRVVLLAVLIGNG